MAFIDFHLKQLVPKVTRILEDTRDFFTRIIEVKDLPENAFLVLFDVAGLHLHIPHEEGIEIKMKFLEKLKIFRQKVYVT